MRGIRGSIALAALALMLSLPFVARAEDPKPWYADRLRELGFRVYAHPAAAPDFQVEALSGGKVKLSDFKGKLVLLNFWATWCPPCREELPSIQALWNKTKDKGLALLAVSVGESKQTVKSFVDRNKYLFPAYLDPSGQAGALYGARSIPTTCVIDKEGRLIAFIVGSRAYDSPEALSLFAELAEK
jgi:peroxiredoxin